MYLWRAVDVEGEVLGTLVHKHRDAATATSFLQKYLRDQPVAPKNIVTNALQSYVSAVEALGLDAVDHPAVCARTNASRTPIFRSVSERHMQQCKSHAFAQRLLTFNGAAYKIFYTQRHLA